MLAEVDAVTVGVLEHERLQAIILVFETFDNPHAVLDALLIERSWISHYEMRDIEAWRGAGRRGRFDGLWNFPDRDDRDKRHRRARDRLRY